MGAQRNLPRTMTSVNSCPHLFPICFSLCTPLPCATSPSFLLSAMLVSGACTYAHSRRGSGVLTPHKAKTARHGVQCWSHTAGAQAITVNDLRHVTLDGQGLQLLLAQSTTETTKPPLLFIHGSYHGAWCWQEHFLPFFAARGFNSYALSLRGQGSSDIVVDQLVAGTLETHAKDIEDLLSMLPRPPVVVGHSFGGLILQKYLLDIAGDGDKPGRAKLAGAAFLCSVPPSGNKTMVGRFFKKDIWLSLRVTYGFIAKAFVTDIKACRELFFSSDLPEQDLVRFQAQLAQCSPVRLMDLQDVNKQVPLPAPPPHIPPVFVLGGTNDVVVDIEAVEETARYFNVQPVLMENVAHDCMLDTRWEDVANKLDAWLEQLP